MPSIVRVGLIGCGGTAARHIRPFFQTVREQALEVDGEIVDAPSLIPCSNPGANFVDAALGQDTVSATGELGLRVAQLSQTAYQSAEERRPVRLA